MSGSEIDDYCELGKNGGAMKSFHPSHEQRPERISQSMYKVAIFLMPESADEKNPKGFLVFWGERFEPRETKPSAAGGGRSEAEVQ